jgi:hypothetical protein
VPNRIGEMRRLRSPPGHVVANAAACRGASADQGGRRRTGAQRRPVAGQPRWPNSAFPGCNVTSQTGNVQVPVLPEHLFVTPEKLPVALLGAPGRLCATPPPKAQRIRPRYQLMRSTSRARWVAIVIAVRCKRTPFSAVVAVGPVVEERRSGDGKAMTHGDFSRVTISRALAI